MAGVVNVAQVCRRRVLNKGLHVRHVGVVGCRNVPRFFFSRKMGLLELRTIRQTRRFKGTGIGIRGPFARSRSARMPEDTYDLRFLLQVMSCTRVRSSKITNKYKCFS
jgi:hypothetical protein